MIVVGVLLVLLVLFFPKGIVGTLRARGRNWIP
jgi:ABC-type branched-subunit amino acid transport system permease subunit